MCLVCLIFSKNARVLLLLAAKIHTTGRVRLTIKHAVNFARTETRYYDNAILNQQGAQPLNYMNMAWLLGFHLPLCFI